MKIFVCSTGRTGTMFMSQVFSELTDIPSYHEVAPYCIGETCRELNNTAKYSKETQAVVDRKIESIKNLTIDGNYFEASNMFIKSFCRPVFETFDDIYCIYIERNMLEVFFSLGERNWQNGQDWLMQSHWQLNLWRTEDKLDYYSNLTWNWYEVRKRFYSWRGVFKKSYVFKFEDINNIDEYHKMFNHFKIPFDALKKLPEPKGRILNENAEGKPITERYTSIIVDFFKKWNREGVEWVFPSDYEELK
ncbi:hypothetical protein LCGC14_2350810 [marine sediment metagenome]|uniref:Sulfotransferase domain-containing protein n=1 Tax=marine sediment metagenome TaxID=412755 RepID=A0A0F9C963_9ZZZZ